MTLAVSLIMRQTHLLGSPFIECSNDPKAASCIKKEPVLYHRSLLESPTMCVGKFNLHIIEIQELECKETEQQILDKCGCSYGILMRLENFQNFRRCDYYDEVRCVKHILQDYLYNRNRSTDKKCLPPCKGVNFEANKVTVSQHFGYFT